MTRSTQLAGIGPGDPENGHAFDMTTAAKTAAVPAVQRLRVSRRLLQRQTKAKSNNRALALTLPPAVGGRIGKLHQILSGTTVTSIPEPMAKVLRTDHRRRAVGKFQRCRRGAPVPLRAETSPPSACRRPDITPFTWATTRSKRSPAATEAKVNVTISYFGGRTAPSTGPKTAGSLPTSSKQQPPGERLIDKLHTYPLL